jgi:hypothetical protein
MSVCQMLDISKRVTCWKTMVGRCLSLFIIKRNGGVGVDIEKGKDNFNFEFGVGS